MLLKKFVFFLLFSLSVLSCSRNEATELHEISGKSIQVSSLKGKWIILNFWAPWCDSCLKEIPELNNFYLHNQDKNILLLSVDYDHVVDADLKKAVQDTDIKFPVLIEDPSQIWNISELEVLPMTFIINPKGKVEKVMAGPNTEQSLLELMDSLKHK